MAPATILRMSPRKQRREVGVDLVMMVVMLARISLTRMFTGSDVAGSDVAVSDQAEEAVLMNGGVGRISRMV